MGLVNGLKRDRVIVYVALLLPIWTGLVLSLSRGGILAMVAQVVVAFILLTRNRQEIESRRERRQSKLLRVALLISLVTVILAGTVWMGGDALVSTFGAASTELNPDPEGFHAGSTRNEIWRASLKMFTAHPLLGVGLGGYWIAITAYHRCIRFHDTPGGT